MNEYTRREEVRWILISAVVLVSCVAASLGLLLTAKGPVTSDPAAIKAAEERVTAAGELQGCVDAAASFKKEVTVFRGVATDSKVLEPPAPPEEEPPPPKGGRPLPPKPKPKPKQPDFSDKAWPAAKPTFERAGRLATCRASVSAALAADAQAEQGWKAVASVVEIAAPKEGAAPDAALAAARKVFDAVDTAPIDAVVTHVTAAQAAATSEANAALEAAKATQVQQPLPRGLLGREVAIAVGVLLSLVALLVSFFSLRATSLRRGGSLTPYRKAAHPPERGLQAATILRLAAEPSGGEPGIVLGAGLGGVVAAAVGRVDADWYVAGVTAGLVVGLLTQIVVKGLGSSKHFRQRALNLAEIEKPAVPIVLVLSTVRVGMEDDFLNFFLRLSPPEAANAVEKLATQAEEQILMAADANAAAR